MGKRRFGRPPGNPDQHVDVFGGPAWGWPLLAVFPAFLLYIIAKAAGWA